jgi:multiple sugar transport system substrate-binding protein
LLEPDGSWTWADAIGHATRLAVPGQRHGLYFYAQSDNRWPVFLLQSGSGFEPGEDGHYRLEGTKMMDNMKLCKAIIRNTDIFPTDHFLESDSDVSELFEQGKVSMMVTTYMSLNSFSAGRVRYDISPVPYAHEPRTLVNVIGIAVNRHSANKQAARCLADYLVSQRAQRLIREHTLSIPALKPVAESLSIVNKSPGSLPRFHMFRDIMAGYRMHRDLRLSTTAFGELRHLLKRYWSGLIDDEQLCKEVDAVVTGNR